MIVKAFLGFIFLILGSALLPTTAQEAKTMSDLLHTHSDYLWEQYRRSEQHLLQLSENQPSHIKHTTTLSQTSPPLPRLTGGKNFQRLLTSYQKQEKQYLHLSEILLQTQHLDDAHPILQQMRVAMEDIRTTQDKIYFQLRTTHPPKLSSASFLPFHQKIEDVIEVQKQLLQSIRHDDPKLQDQYLRKMNTLLPALIKNKGKGMAQIPRRRGSKHDPLRLCEQILKRLTDFSQEVQFYPGHLSIPSLYHPLGKISYASNHHLRNLLDAKGEGTIDLFNRWSELLGYTGTPTVPELPFIWLPPAPKDFIPPRQIIVLVDGSGSMAKNQRYQRALSPVYIGTRRMREADYVQYIRWAEPLAVVSWEGIQTHQPSGELPLQRGIEMGVQYALAGNQESHLWIVTDGGFQTSPQMVRWIEQQTFKGLHLHFAYIGDYPEKQLPRLKELAKIGGGTCMNLHDQKDQILWQDWWSGKVQIAHQVSTSDYSGR